MIKIQTSSKSLSLTEVQSYQNKVSRIHEQINNQVDRQEMGLGWLRWPQSLKDSTIDEIIARVSQIKSLYQPKYLVLIGVGGSSLGAWSAYQWLKQAKPDVQLLLAGNNLSMRYINDILKIVHNESYLVCVVSKSGGTLEPAIALRIFNRALLKQYGEEGHKRIIVVTEENNKALHKISAKQNLTRFIIPNTIGGRYSVLTPVGLVPLALCGFHIKNIIAGARQAQADLSTCDLGVNTAYQYAVMRFLCYEKLQLKIELLTSYEPQFFAVQQWWQQLFGESEGKAGKGLFPGLVSFTQDLHSLGQYIQQGPHHFMFETVCEILNDGKNDSLIYVPSTEHNLENLNYLSKTALSDINTTALEAVMKAHEEAGVPQIRLTLSNFSAQQLGYLYYWMMKAVTMSAMLLGVNPFDQPGVEVYKHHLQQKLKFTASK